MLTGETTRRSDLDPDQIFAALREVGLARLQDTEHLWLVLDGSDLRKPYAQCMEALQRVRSLSGGLIPWYPTLTVLGLSGDSRRGLLHQRLYSSQADDCVSAPSETRQAIWEAIWAAGWHLV